MEKTHLSGVLRLARGECLARLINTFVKGRHLESGEAPKHGTVLPGV